MTARMMHQIVEKGVSVGSASRSSSTKSERAWISRSRASQRCLGRSKSLEAQPQMALVEDVGPQA